MRLAAETGLDWRTVDRAYSGGRVATATRELLLRASKDLECLPPPEAP